MSEKMKSEDVSITQAPSAPAATVTTMPKQTVPPHKKAPRWRLVVFFVALVALTGGGYVWWQAGFTFDISRFFAAEVGTLQVQCGKTENVLTWTYDSRANTNSIERGNNGPKNLPNCADYWCWLPSVNYSHQAPTPGNPVQYIDSQLQEGQCYEYRVDYQPQLPSNSVFCPTNCVTPTIGTQSTTPSPSSEPTVTPTPTIGTQSTTPSPTTIAQAVTCAPAAQTIGVNQAATLQANGGVGSYDWSSPGGTQESASGAFLTVSYGQTGGYTVTVTDGAGESAQCTVSVVQVSPTPTVTLTTAPGPTPADVSLSVAKTVRNVTRGTSEAHSVQAHAGETLEFIIRITANGSTTVQGVLISDALPQGYLSMAGSTTVDGTSVADGIVFGGISVGDLIPGRSVVVRFRTTVQSSAVSSENVAYARAVNSALQWSDSATILIASPTGSPFEITQVQTGPGEASVLALIVSAIVTLMYVGYTSTDTFRRRDVSRYSRHHKESSFK